jgi:DNA-binding MarR family transcriptional regulator
MNRNFSREFDSILKNLLRKVNKIDRNEKVCYGVTVSQCLIIDILHNQKELSMNKLGGETGLAISTLTRIVDLLVRDKLVKRSRSSDDRRKVILTLTAKGKELQNKLHLCSLEYTGEILSKIPANKREDIIQALKLLESAVSNRALACCIPGSKGD